MSRAIRLWFLCPDTQIHKLNTQKMVFLKIWIRLCLHRNWYLNIYELWKVLQEIVLLSFCHPHRNRMETFFLFQNKFSFLLCLFAIFIAVCNSHLLVYSSYMDVCNFHMSLQFSYEFAIFISVCNSHVTTPALTYIALHGFYVTMT